MNIGTQNRKISKMKRKVGTQEIEISKGKYAKVDLIEDSELLEEAKYLIKSFNALRAIEGGPKLPNGLKLEIYGTQLPNFCRTQNGAYFSGVTINTEPGEVYTILIDERLKPHEKLATLTHELCHLLGGWKSSDRQTQKLAIKELTELVSLYDVLSKPEVKRKIKEETNGNFNPKEIPRDELMDSLQYLIDSGKVFGVTPQDWKEVGLKSLEDYVSIILLIAGGIMGISNQFSSITGFATLTSYSYQKISLTSIILICLGISLIFNKKRRNLKKNT